MSDHKRLKHLALAQPVQQWRSEEGEPSMMNGERMYHVIGPGGVSCWEHGAYNRVSASYIAAANPAVVLELIAENEAMAKRIMTIDIVHGPKAELRWIALVAERDQLKAECEGLRATLTDCSDSLHSEMLGKFGGQIPDDMHPVTRREYDRDMAEVAGYREVLSKEPIK